MLHLDLKLTGVLNMPIELAYCDKIAWIVRESLVQSHSLGFDPELHVGLVGPINWDLNPTEGYLESTKKTIEVSDMNGKLYRVTVEEM